MTERFVNKQAKKDNMQSSWGWQQNGKEKENKNQYSANGVYVPEHFNLFPVLENAKSLLTLNPLTHESIHAKQFNDQLKQWNEHDER